MVFPAISPMRTDRPIEFYLIYMIIQCDEPNTLLKIIIEPQISIIRAATVNVGSRDDKSAEFGARIAVVAVKKIGANFYVYVLGDIPDGPGLQNSGRIFDIVDAGQKNFKQRVQFNLDFSAQIVFGQHK